tara:strand:- start:1080 stop:1625 length:546 start_codon:yes stop_codon:yes gene_type:complete
MKIELLILDVDGVMTDGTKIYNEEHEVLGKRFLCKDFTAIKRFIAAGIKVIMLSGDNFNRKMAEKRNIPFYCSRGSDLSLDKSRFIDIFEKEYGISKQKMAFVGDDYFDLSMFKSLEHTFSTADSPAIIKQNSFYVLESFGGTGAIVELYDHFLSTGWLTDATEDQVAHLDKLEATSKEMG